MAGVELRNAVTDTKIPDEAHHGQRIEAAGLINLTLHAVGFDDLLIQQSAIQHRRLFRRYRGRLRILFGGAAA
ncbi:MAG: hypothetical protein KIB40_05140 [Pantoea sp.]|nr:hypothetical protein [Pantoea sp.]